VKKGKIIKAQGKKSGRVALEWRCLRGRTQEIAVRLRSWSRIPTGYLMRGGSRAKMIPYRSFCLLPCSISLLPFLT